MITRINKQEEIACPGYLQFSFIFYSSSLFLLLHRFSLVPVAKVVSLLVCSYLLHRLGAVPAASPLPQARDTLLFFFFFFFFSRSPADFLSLSLNRYHTLQLVAVLPLSLSLYINLRIYLSPFISSYLLSSRLKPTT